VAGTSTAARTTDAESSAPFPNKRTRRCEGPL
jgi:hypothetical protein